MWQLYTYYLGVAFLEKYFLVAFCSFHISESKLKLKLSHVSRKNEIIYLRLGKHTNTLATKN